MRNLETLDVGQANELKLAFRRTGWTNEEIKRLCEGNTLAEVRDVLLGRAEIKSLQFSFTIPALSRLAKSEICSKYGFKSVECDNSPEGEVVMVLETVLRNGESSIDGKEYEMRLRTVSGQLGLSQALWIVEHQDELPSWFMELLGKVYIDFPATIAVYSRGYRRVPCLGRGGSRWSLGWYWLDGGFDSNGRVACSRPPAERAGK